MGLNTNFQSGAILYAANLNTTFANTVSVAGDTITGVLNLSGPSTSLSVANAAAVGTLTVNTALSINNIDIGSGLAYASALANNLSTNAAVKITYVASLGLTVNSNTTLTVTGNNTVVIGANGSSTTQPGIVQLADNLLTTNASQALTANIGNFLYNNVLHANLWNEVANSTFDYNGSANNNQAGYVLVTRAGLAAANVTILNAPAGVRGNLFDFPQYNGGWKSQWMFPGGNSGQPIYLRGTGGNTGDWGQWYSTLLADANSNVVVANNFTSIGPIVSHAGITGSTITSNGVATLGSTTFTNGVPMTVQNAILMQTAVPIYLRDSNVLNNYNVASFAATVGINYTAILENFNTNSIVDQGETIWDWNPSSNASTSAWVKTGHGNPGANGRWILRTTGKPLYPEQFGAIGDGQTDDWLAFQNMLNGLENSGSANLAFPSTFSGATVRLTPNKRYYIGGGPGMTSALTWTSNTSYISGQIVTNPIKYYYSPAQANGAPFANGASLLFNNLGNLYICNQSGTSANTNSTLQTGPTGVNGKAIVDGTATWDFVSSNNLVFLNKTTIIGDQTTSSMPALLAGNNAVFTANAGGFILNPNITIQLKGSSGLERTIILPSTLQYNPTPNADGVIAAVRAWGNTNSIGVWMNGAAPTLRDCLIVGFNTGVLCNSGSKSINRLQIDCYNGMEFYRIGDTGLCSNITLEPFYQPYTGQSDPGSGTIPNEWRPGIGFNIHDRCDGYEFDKLFAFNYKIGLKVSNVWAMQVRNFSTDCGAVLPSDPLNPTISVLIANTVSYFGLVTPNFVGPQTWYLYNSACDAFDISQPNPLTINRGGFGANNSSPGLTNGVAGVYTHGGFWGPNIYLGPGSRTTIADATFNMSSYVTGMQMDDNIKYASISNITLLQGGGKAWLNANNNLVTTGRLVVDGVHHTEGEYSTRLTRLTTQRATHTHDPSVLDGVNDPWQPSSVYNINSQKRQDATNPNRTLGIMRNWAEVGYIDATNQGMILDTNNQIFCITGISSVANTGTGYQVGNIVQLTGGNLAQPGQNAAIVVTSVAANGGILSANIVQGGAYTAFPATANTLGIVSGIQIVNGGVNYQQNGTKTVIIGDGSGASFGPSTINANGSITTMSNSFYQGYGVLSSGFGSGYSTANVTVYAISNYGTANGGANAVLTANIGTGAQFNVTLAHPNTLTINPSGNTVFANDVIMNGGAGALTVNGTMAVVSDTVVTGNVYVNGATGIRTNHLEANSGSDLIISPGGNTHQIIFGDGIYGIGTIGTMLFQGGQMQFTIPSGEIRAQTLYGGLQGTTTFNGAPQSATGPQYGLLVNENLAGNTNAQFSANKIVINQDTVSYTTPGLQGGNWLNIGGSYGAQPWVGNTTFSINSVIGNFGNLYVAIQGGTSNTDPANTGPTGNTLSANVTDNGIIWNYIGLNGGGSRSPLSVGLNIRSQIGLPPGATGSGDSERQWQSEVLTTSISYNQGGTAPTSGLSKAFVYSGGDQMWAFSGATNLSGIIGREIDVGIYTGASSAQRTGLQVVSFGNNQGNDKDIAYYVGATGAGTANAAPPFKTSIAFGMGVTNANSTLIGYQYPIGLSGAGNIYVNPVANYGLDLQPWSFANAAIRSVGGFKVGPLGSVYTGAANIISSAANSSTIIDVNGWTISNVTSIITGPAYANGDIICEPLSGTLFNVGVNASKVVTSLTIVTQGYIYGLQPSNTITLLGGTGIGCSVNVTWTPITTLTLNPSGNTVFANDVIMNGGIGALTVNGTLNVNNVLTASGNIIANTVIYKGAQADQSANVWVATNAGSFTIPNNCSWEHLAPVGTIAAFTLTMPAIPIDRQDMWISTSNTISAFTLNGNGGQIVNGDLISAVFTLNTSYHFRYLASINTWVRMS